MRPLLVLCLFSALFLACSETPDVVVPKSSSDVLMSETRRLTPVMRSSMEGVYVVHDGAEVFGDRVVLKWSYTVAENLTDTSFYLSVFSGRDVGYFILEGGTLDSVFLFSGYWRKMVNTETGIANFAISMSHGGRQLFQKNPVIGKDSIVFAGEFGTGQSLPNQMVKFTYERPLDQTRKFAVIAHRGGGRTSDLLPAAENSVEMILFTPRLGSNSIEIDVRFTKDGVPILYHDGELNSRLTQKTGLVGPIEEYTYPQLQAYVRLIHGERIPTFQQALDVALYRTPIRGVYLDVKAGKDMPAIRAIQKEYLAKAAAAGREFQILIGLPNQEIMDAFMALPDYASAPCLCELTIDDARKTKALAWAPRWTLGTQLSETAQMHAEGRKVYTWTVDVASWVETYIRTGDFDGILTNYCPMVAYYHYTR
jgi:glycerophosphoryl diester phosphodiesterase